MQLEPILDMKCSVLSVQFPLSLSRCLSLSLSLSFYFSLSLSFNKKHAFGLSNVFAMMTQMTQSMFLDLVFLRRMLLFVCLFLFYFIFFRGEGCLCYFALCHFLPMSFAVLSCLPQAHEKLRKDQVEFESALNDIQHQLEESRQVRSWLLLGVKFMEYQGCTILNLSLIHI